MSTFPPWWLESGEILGYGAGRSLIKKTGQWSRDGLNCVKWAIEAAGVLGFQWQTGCLFLAPSQDALGVLLLLLLLLLLLKLASAQAGIGLATPHARLSSKPIGFR